MTDMTWRERLEWLAEKHITREYRTTTFGEHDARQILALLAIAEASEGLRADAMRSIGELIRTQDNRITDSPIFIVQQKRRVWGIADDYTETFAWVDDDASEHYDDAEKAVRDAERAEDGSSPIEWRQVGYIDLWEFVTACFTEQGCKDYIARDGHNLKQPRIYAAGSYRNNEWRTVRESLIASAALSGAVTAGEG